ncbi:MAG: hypothetical protein M3362_23470, partial [Acidobacteriota bacterium]|nr:hypothetical protein [Acidobacteriota bacterium]
MRNEVQQLRGELDRLRSLVEKGASQPQPPTTDTLPSVKPEALDAARSTSPVQDDKRVAVATKSQGGDLAGAGNLLRTDRITIGGYGDAQFRTAGVNERAEGGGTPSFVN